MTRKSPGPEEIENTLRYLVDSVTKSPSIQSSSTGRLVVKREYDESGEEGLRILLDLGSVWYE